MLLSWLRACINKSLVPPRVQIFNAQASFFSRFLGGDADGASQLAQRVLAVTFGASAGLGLKPAAPPPSRNKTEPSRAEPS